MNLRPIIDDVAGQTDELLAGITDRAAARDALAEFLKLERPRLASADRRLVLDHVMAWLEDESFFPERFVDSFDTDQSTEPAETDPFET